MATLNRIANEIAGEFNIKSDLARSVAEAIFKKIVEHAAIADPVSVQGFGTFRIQFHPGKDARNPQTGGPVHVPEKWKMHWKASPLLAETLNKMVSEQQRRRA